MERLRLGVELETWVWMFGKMDVVCVCVYRDCVLCRDGCMHACVCGDTRVYVWRDCDMYVEIVFWREAVCRKRQVYVCRLCVYGNTEVWVWNLRWV